MVSIIEYVKSLDHYNSNKKLFYFERDNKLFIYHIKTKKILLIEKNLEEKGYLLSTFIKDSNSIKLYKTSKLSIKDIKELFNNLDNYKAKAFINLENYMYHNKAYFFLTNACNLKCRYCYQESKPVKMNFSMSKKSIDMMIKNKRKTETDFQIRFFGGEPLLNYKLMKQIINYCSNDRFNDNNTFNYYLSTNGLLLDSEKLSFMNDSNTKIKISVDGNRETFNYYRKSAKYKDVYCVLIKKLKEVFKYYPNELLTAGITNNYYNINFCENLQHAYEIGFRNFYIQFVCNNDFYEERLPDILAEKYDEIINEYEKILSFINIKINSGQEIYVNLLDSFIKFLFVPLNSLCGCSAGIASCAYDNVGNIYFCQRFIGNEKYIIGNVEKGLDRQKIKTIRNFNVMDRCVNCPIRDYCMGGCFFNNYKNSKILDNYLQYDCDIKVKLFEKLIYYTFKIAQKDIGFINNIYNKREFVE